MHQKYNDDYFITGSTFFQNRFCDIGSQSDRLNTRNYSSTARKIHPFCWNDTKTFNNKLYKSSPDACNSTDCISSYRLNDGFRDCENTYDESYKGVYRQSSCESIRQYRFQCPKHQESCILVSEINTIHNDCPVDVINGQSIKTLTCKNRHDQNCKILKDFIAMSSVPKNQSLLLNTTVTNVIPSTNKALSFYQYCDTFLDLKTNIDESRELCPNWICAKEQYQCLTGQCIPFGWICDGKCFTYKIAKK